MNDIEILENMRDNIYGAMQFEDDYQVSELEKEEFHALNSAITALKERQADRGRIKQLEELKSKHNVRINDLCAMVDIFAYDSIPKSLVKEKIEDIKTNKLRYYHIAPETWTINILQELLGEKQ